MTYTEVQQAVKVYKLKGLTTIKLNSSRTDLEAELLRLESAPVAGEVSADEVVKISQLEDEQVAKTEPETPQSTDAKEIDTVAKVLPLAVEGRWFGMIASGEKKEEYRAIKPYYESRFNKPLTHIKFTNGYGDDRPSFTIELLGIEKGIPKPEWSEGTIEQGTEVYVLKLGKIIDANFELPAISEGDSGLICPECEGMGEILNDQGVYEPCNDCDGTGRLEEPDEDEPIAWIDGEALYAPSPNADYHCADDVDLFIDDVDEEIETFLGDVPQLSDEQKEAIASALTFANDRNITASEALAQAGQFRLFTPNQLLAWGFDHIIPRSGMLARFRDAITASRKRAIVTIEFNPNPENATLLTAWAASYDGIIYCRTQKDSYQHEEWGFSSVESAEHFCEFCSKLDFVQSATIKTNALGVEIPEKKLVEVVA